MTDTVRQLRSAARRLDRAEEALRKARANMRHVLNEARDEHSVRALARTIGRSSSATHELLRRRE